MDEKVNSKEEKWYKKWRLFFPLVDGALSESSTEWKYNPRNKEWKLRFTTQSKVDFNSV